MLLLYRKIKKRQIFARNLNALAEIYQGIRIVWPFLAIAAGPSSIATLFIFRFLRTLVPAIYVSVFTTMTSSPCFPAVWSNCPVAMRTFFHDNLLSKDISLY